MPADLVYSWDEVPTGLLPSAPLTGPFPTRPFLEAWRSHHTASDATTPIAIAAAGAVPLWIDDDVVRFAGQANLTDYHSPLGGPLHECVSLVAKRYSGSRFSFDSLPNEALEPLASALGAAGVGATARTHDATLIIDLPADHDGWFRSLPKKRRHEIRRKRRR
ncbi:MAG: hypothetical protein U9N78_00290, partial [Actinomycetota bacterium]|nr:hypothetical protein [Actinomycetota bacterium]